MRKNTYFVARIVFSSMAFGLFLCLSTLSTHAATITVSTLIDEPGTGADCSLREAIISANNDMAFGGCASGAGSDDIVFSVTGIIQLKGSLPGLVSDMNIINTAGPSTLTVRRNTASDYQVFFIPVPEGPTVISISGLTLTNGSSPTGGGIQNSANLTVSNCIITGNTATQFAGGGIYNLGTLAISNSTISGNIALSGIGGAGIENAGTMTITNSTVSGNRMMAAVGNCAGGVSSSSPLTIVNSTITDNEAVASTTCASGVRRNTDGTITVANSIIAGGRNNTVVPDVSGEFISAGFNLIGSSDAGTGFADGVNGDHVGTMASPIDPRLGPLQDNGGPTPTHALLAGSPAMEGGNNSLAVDPVTNTALVNDQRGSGFPRVINSKVDIGAFEDQEVHEVLNTPPTISGADISVRQGMTSTFKVAAVADQEDAVGALTVAVNGGASASLNAVTVSNLTVDAQGNVTADISATCTATNANFVLRVSDSAGLFAEATLNVSVTKSGAPGITLNRPITLFPPNHWYVPITLREMVRSVSDDCDANLTRTVTIEKVTSDEPDNARGDADGNTTHDMVILPGGSIVFLRAERNERLNGRVYNVILKVTDSSGNVTRASFKVFVPIHRRGTAIEDPVANTVVR